MQKNRERKSGLKEGKKQRNRGAEKNSGIDDGRKAEKKENAKRMKELKMSDEQICQILNITANELKELIEK